MKSYAVKRGNDWHYFLNGREVTKEEYEKDFPPLRGEGSPALHCWKKPMLSDAMAVHSEQIEEVAALDKAKGVPTSYLEDGRPIITSEDHKRRLMRSRGLHDRNSYF